MIGCTNVKLGSAEMVQLNHDFELWLYILDADWSDLIDICDLTCTVYISFVALAWAATSSLQPVVHNVFPCSHFS